MFDPYVTEAFTIRDLLTHRSGLGLGAGDLMLFPDHSDFTINDVIHNLQFLKPVSSFRSKFDYDNIGNYVLVIKLKKDLNTIRGSMPIDIRLRFINRHLGSFTTETQKMIIDYVKKYNPLVKEQEGIQRKIINSRRARIGRSNHRSNSSSRSASFRITT
jgi:hypothetical protein